MAASPAGRDVHLVGSVPFKDAAEVFRTASAILGDRMRRIPDGETGDRRHWVAFQYLLLSRHPQFEFAKTPEDLDEVRRPRTEQGSEYVFAAQVRLKPGVRPEDLRFGSLGYVACAVESYAAFKALQQSGDVPPGCRFQVSLPTPLACVARFVVEGENYRVFPLYKAAMLAELDAILAAIPNQDLAIQWDVATEFAIWEGVHARPPGDWRELILDELSELGNHVAAGVELGYHLCYGDRGRTHFVQPKDAGNLTDIANQICARVGRPVQWIHMPVPRERDDAAYFAPLKNLALKPETRLFLGLVHATDGVEGTRRRIVADFGIATECGLGRREEGTIADLLRLHAEVAG